MLGTNDANEDYDDAAQAEKAPRLREASLLQQGMNHDDQFAASCFDLDFGGGDEFGGGFDEGDFSRKFAQPDDRMEVIYANNL